MTDVVPLLLVAVSFKIYVYHRVSVIGTSVDHTLFSPDSDSLLSIICVVSLSLINVPFRLVIVLGDESVTVIVRVWPFRTSSGLNVTLFISGPVLLDPWLMEKFPFTPSSGLRIMGVGVRLGVGFCVSIVISLFGFVSTNSVFIESKKKITPMERVMRMIRNTVSGVKNFDWGTAEASGSAGGGIIFFSGNLFAIIYLFSVW